jgi:hypothetical protein
MRILILSTLALLSACALPGRQTIATAPVAPDTTSISATHSFSGRIPLVTILPGTTDFRSPVASAVHQALTIKPGASFDVEAQTPVSGNPAAAAGSMQALAGTATSVHDAIVADGVPADRVSLTARTAGLDAEILVFVK